MMMRNILFFLILIQCYSCGNSGSTTQCQYGTPVAIFDNSIPGVSQHQFSAKGQNATESLQFAKGQSLEVLQSGCNSIAQEFRFTIPGKPAANTDAFWIDQAVQLFHFLGDLSNRHLQYHQWANAIQQVAPEMRLAEAVQLGDGFSLKIDRIAGVNSNLLQIEVTQGKE